MKARYLLPLLLLFAFLPSFVCACSVQDVLNGSSSSNCSRYILAVDDRGLEVKYFLLPDDRNTVVLSFAFKNYDSVDGAVCLSSSPDINITTTSGDLCFTVPANGVVPVSVTVTYEPVDMNMYYLYYSTPFDTRSIALLVYPKRNDSPFSIGFWLENMDLLVGLVLVAVAIFVLFKYGVPAYERLSR